MKNHVLMLENITKQFGSFTAVDNISLAVEEGEIVGLLGPNGAGKTTTIQMLLGVLSPSSGKISYFGKSFAENREEILENINFSSSYINLPWRLTVVENLTWVSYLYNIENRSKRVTEVIEIFKLNSFSKKTIAQLSEGQKTRVNLAKSFINFPKILLLDEPTASMDPEIASYLRELILLRKKKYGMSIIWTSHNMSEVEEMCDRVIFINNGQIVASDTPARLAGSIENAHVSFIFAKDLQKAVAFCKKKKMVYKINKNTLAVDVREKEISSFLQQLTTDGVFYDEISIEKPTLEDYFLEAAKK